MKNFVIFSLLSLFVFVPGICGATDETDFIVKTTADLIDLCTTSPEEPLFAQAVNFCHGYLVGAYHYYQSISAGAQGLELVCLPDTKPTRNEVIGMFIAWVKDHPQYWNEPAVETEFRFLMEKWPCKP